MDCSGSETVGSSRVLLMLCRGFDVVAPIIHEWTYEAMVYDLLKLEGNVFQYQSETQGGRSEAKEHLLDERDELWLKLRHEHFASAASQITRLLDEFRSKHKAANYKGAGDGTGLDMRGMRSLVQSLPQYR
jgi:syntaxin-binding protein 1